MPWPLRWPRGSQRLAPLGLDVAALDDRERAALPLVPGVVVEQGRAKVAGQADPLAGHPFVAALEAGRFSPPGAEGVDRAELRELARRGLVVERDGVWFAPSAIDAAAAVAASLLARQPQGFTVGELRDAVGTTRKHAVPLANELDARGITRRRGDLRIAGPALRRAPEQAQPKALRDSAGPGAIGQCPCRRPARLPAARALFRLGLQRELAHR